MSLFTKAPTGSAIIVNQSRCIVCENYLVSQKEERRLFGIADIVQRVKRTTALLPICCYAVAQTWWSYL